MEENEMGVVVAMTMRRGFFKRWWHYLFECPTWWNRKPAFTCPDCGAQYRCYWDGHDAGGKINLCGHCARKYGNN
jgi:hypothetical protein